MVIHLKMVNLKIRLDYFMLIKHFVEDTTATQNSDDIKKNPLFVSPQD